MLERRSIPQLRSKEVNGIHGTVENFLEYLILRCRESSNGLEYTFYSPVVSMHCIPSGTQGARANSKS